MVSPTCVPAHPYSLHITSTLVECTPWEAFMILPTLYLFLATCRLPCYLWNTVLLLRSEVDKFIYSIARSSCGGALSTKCSVALSTEALRWRFGVAVVVLMLSKHTALITNKPISLVSTYNGNQQPIRIKSIQENPNE